MPMEEFVALRFPCGQEQLGDEAGMTEIERAHVHLLGAFRVAIGAHVVPERAWTRRAAADIVKFLAMEPGHSVHPEVLAETLWPDLSPLATGNKLHKALHAARRALEPTLAPHTASTYVSVAENTISLAHVWVDVDRFESLARTALQSASRSGVEAALAAYTGAPLPADQYRDWTYVRRHEIVDLHRRLVLTLIHLLEEQGSYQAAIGHLQVLLRDNAADESVHRRIMELHVRAGDPDEALRQYTILREALRHEVGAPPDRDTEDLRVAIEQSRCQPEAEVLARSAGARERLTARIQMARTLAAIGKYDEALSHLEDALTHSGDCGDAQASVLAEIGHVYFSAARPAAGIPRLEEMCHDHLSASAGSALLGALAGLYWLQGNHARQLEAAEVAEQLAQETGDPAAGAEASVWHGVALVALERIEEGIVTLERAATRAEAASEPGLTSRALNTIAAVLQEQGEYEQAHPYLESAIVFAARAADTARLTFMLYRAGWNAWNLGLWDEAQRAMERAIAVSDPFPDMWPRPYALHGLAWLHLCRGQYEQARQWSARAAGEGERGGDERSHWSLSGLLGALALREGDFDRAETHLCSALGGSGLTDADRALFLASLVRIALARRDLGAASRHLSQAAQRAEGAGAKPALLEVLLARASLHRQEGSLVAAAEAAAEAEEIAGEMKQTFHLARARIERARIEHLLGHRAAATLLDRSAHDTFDTLGILPHARENL